MDNKIRIDFKQILRDVYGTPVKTEDRTVQPTTVLPNGQKVYPEIEMPLHHACVQALLYSPGPDKQQPSRELGRKRYLVSCKIAKAALDGHSGVVALKPDEVTATLDAVDLMYGPVVTGAVHAIFNASDDDAALAEAYAGIGKPAQEDMQ